MTDFFPGHFSEWKPCWQAAGFFLGTFILEDVATVGAGLLLAAGTVSWPAAFWGCFLGIWGGDAGLYALARLGGRSWFDRSSLARFRQKVAQSEKWFGRRGIPILLLSRLMPGARLPTYLAAGFLRVPINRFAIVTGMASLAWTILLLAGTQLAGTRLLAWLTRFAHVSWFMLGLLVCFWGILCATRRLLRFESRRRFVAAMMRLKRWEFWPAWLFYPPVALYCLRLAIKYRGLNLPMLSNPGIFAGGIVGESKMATLRELMRTSHEFTAAAELLEGPTPEERLRCLEKIRERLNLDYPFILKPDVGQRGAGVKLIHNQEQAREYLRRTAAPLLAQRYAPGPYEAGILYYRFPHETRGRIFAITEKLFPFVIGDGRSTVSELIWQEPRARLLAAKYLARFKGRENRVPPAGQAVRLVEAGNHAAGCVFRDGMHLCSPALLAQIDSVSQKLEGFYFGRYDLRYRSEAELMEGRNFQIVELNGAASEATSIYDARNSLWTAYRTLFRQWDLVFAIGAENRTRGVKAASISLLWRKWQQYTAWAATYPHTD